MLESFFDCEKLGEHIVSREEFKPLPAIGDRKKWDGLSEHLKMRMTANAEAFLGFAWPQLPAALYMEHGRIGNRVNYENVYFARRFALGSLVLGECAENRGRFLNDIINGIWQLCEESAWWIPNHVVLSRAQKDEILPEISDPIVDLFAAETAAMLAWTMYLLGSRLDGTSKVICRRIRQEIDRRVITPYLEREDFFWMGYSGGGRSNWNAWCNSNCLAVFLLVEEDEKRRVQGIKKTLECINRFINAYPEDGGCDEGPGYWTQAGGALFDFLDLVHMATQGWVDIFREAKIREIGSYIYKVHISNDYYMNHADALTRIEVPANLLLRFGKRTCDRKLQDLGLYSHALFPEKILESRWLPMFRTLMYIFGCEDMNREWANAPFLRDVWLQSIQVMAARETEGSDRGFFLAAKGGHNSENHNHNDVGSFYVYFNGSPVLVDVGEGDYTAKHSGPRRYEIWNLQSAYHNLPTVNGIMQKEGGCYKASDVNYHLSSGCAAISMDIAGAYPDSSVIAKWRRTYRLVREGSSHVEIEEDFVLKTESEDICLSLMTPRLPDISLNGRILLPVGGTEHIRIGYAADDLAACFEKIPIENARLSACWNGEMYRIILKSRIPVSSARWTIKISR